MVSVLWVLMLRLELGLGVRSELGLGLGLGLELLEAIFFFPFSFSFSFVSDARTRVYGGACGCGRAGWYRDARVRWAGACCCCCEVWGAVLFLGDDVAGSIGDALPACRRRRRLSKVAAAGSRPGAAGAGRRTRRASCDEGPALALLLVSGAGM